MLQSLPPMLRMNPAVPIRSYSKAPGVFSSNYRYPASSPELHFHRASPRDSFPLITPFVHVGTYPTRNYALRFLLTREGPYLVPDLASGLRRMASHLSRYWTSHRLLHDKVAFVFLFTHIHNRPSPSAFDRSRTRNLRTIIVIADIHRGLHSPASH